MSSTEVRSLSRLLHYLQPGDLLDGAVPAHPVFEAFWTDACSDSFAAPARVRAVRASKVK